MTSSPSASSSAAPREDGLVIGAVVAIVFALICLGFLTLRGEPVYARVFALISALGLTILALKLLNVF